jgi:hypothetical protein
VLKGVKEEMRASIGSLPSPLGEFHSMAHLYFDIKVSKMMNDYIKMQKDWLTIIYLPKKAPYLNTNERNVNQQIKSYVCANRFMKI